jgi:hypothetical protein
LFADIRHKPETLRDTPRLWVYHQPTHLSLKRLLDVTRKPPRRFSDPLSFSYGSLASAHPNLSLLYIEVFDHALSHFRVRHKTFEHPAALHRTGKLRRCAAERQTRRFALKHPAHVSHGNEAAHRPHLLTQLRLEFRRLHQ